MKGAKKKKLYTIRRAGFEPTIEKSNKFTVCRLKPLSHLLFFKKTLGALGVEPRTLDLKGHRSTIKLYTPIQHNIKKKY